MSSSNFRAPRIYYEPRQRLPSITPSTFSIDESSVAYIDNEEEFSPQLNQNIHQERKLDEKKEAKEYNSIEMHDDKKHQGKVMKGFKKMLNKFMFVDVPTTDINHDNNYIDEKGAYITWLVGL